MMYWARIAHFQFGRKREGNSVRKEPYFLVSWEILAVFDFVCVSFLRLDYTARFRGPSSRRIEKNSEKRTLRTESRRKKVEKGKRETTFRLNLTISFFATILFLCYFGIFIAMLIRSFSIFNGP